MMEPNLALQELLQALDCLEGQLEQDEAIHSDRVDLACQNLLQSGQNFDRLPVSSEKDPSSRSAADPRLLEQVRDRLRLSIDRAEQARESIEERLQHIQRGRRCLRGYNCIEPIASRQYLSISR